MKKIIVGVLLLAACYSLNAQVKVYRLDNTSTNQAYTVPEYIVVDFSNTYPAAVTTVVWEPVTDLWRASYKENNRITHVYYNTNGVNYRVSLPKINTYVPDPVISAAIDTYGTALYSITRMKPVGDIEIYQVRLMDANITKDTWMDSKGSVLTEAEVYKIKLDDEKLKIKSDEQKMKMKVDENKMKISNEQQ